MEQSMNSIKIYRLNTRARERGQAARQTETEGTRTRESIRARPLSGGSRTGTGASGTRRPPPKFAENADEILDQLGYDATEIAALRAAGVVHDKRRV